MTCECFKYIIWNLYFICIYIYAQCPTNSIFKIGNLKIIIFWWQVFNGIIKIATRSNYGVDVKVTQKTKTMTITHIDKMKYILRRGMSEEPLLVKTFADRTRSEVTASPKNPIVIRYSITKQKASFRLKFNVFNAHGVQLNI